MGNNDKNTQQDEFLSEGAIKFLYESQLQRKPTLFNYITTYKFISVVVIAFLIYRHFDNGLAGISVVAAYLYYDLPRNHLNFKMKFNDRKNILNKINVIKEKFYKVKDNGDLAQLLYDEVVVENANKDAK